MHRAQMTTNKSTVYHTTKKHKQEDSNLTNSKQSVWTKKGNFGDRGCVRRILKDIKEIVFKSLVLRPNLKALKLDSLNRKFSLGRDISQNI